MTRLPAIGADFVDLEELGAVLSGRLRLRLQYGAVQEGNAAHGKKVEADGALTPEEAGIVPLDQNFNLKLLRSSTKPKIFCSRRH